jgi:zinc transport system permease protein
MFLKALTENFFLQMALWASLLASFASGVVGSYVVVKRIAFIAGGISHAVVGGMGICLYLQRSLGIAWLDPLLGAFATAIIAALLLGWTHLNYRQREDAVIAAIWSTGMAVGIIFLSLTPGTNVDLLNFLFGNVLWVSSTDLLLLAGLDILLLLIVALNYRKFLAICFDEDQALLQGVPVKKLYLLLQVIGTILVLALLTIPPTLATLFTNRLHIMMVASTFFCAFFSVFGLALAYSLNWPPGATISLLAALAYLICLPLKKTFSLKRL